MAIRAKCRKLEKNRLHSVLNVLLKFVYGSSSSLWNVDKIPKIDLILNLLQNFDNYAYG